MELCQCCIDQNVAATHSLLSSVMGNLFLSRPTHNNSFIFMSINLLNLFYLNKCIDLLTIYFTIINGIENVNKNYNKQSFNKNFFQPHIMLCVNMHYLPAYCSNRPTNKTSILSCFISPFLSCFSLLLLGAFFTVHNLRCQFSYLNKVRLPPLASSCAPFPFSVEFLVKFLLKVQNNTKKCIIKITDLYQVLIKQKS